MSEYYAVDATLLRVVFPLSFLLLSSHRSLRACVWEREKKGGSFSFPLFCFSVSVNKDHNRDHWSEYVAPFLFCLVLPFYNKRTGEQNVVYSRYAASRAQDFYSVVMILVTCCSRHGGGQSTLRGFFVARRSPMQVLFTGWRIAPLSVGYKSVSISL